MLNVKPKNLKKYYTIFYVILFYAILAAVLTWPVVINFTSAVPSWGADTMQVIGAAGNQANFLADEGFFKGTFNLIKSSQFGIITIYAYLQLITGRVAAYNLLFFFSFVMSGLGAFLLARYFLRRSFGEDKTFLAVWPALLAGIIFAFSPFHMHNAMSTNVGTMHQEWLPFFALCLFKFFEDLKFKNFVLAGLFLGLIGFTEHQLLAFTLIFVLLFAVYKIFTQPKVFIRPKFWLYFMISVVVFTVVFSVMFQSLIKVATSEENFLDPGLESAVKYSNDSLSVLIPPRFHSLWPDTFFGLREQFERKTKSNFSIYAGYSVLFLSLAALIRSIIGWRRIKEKKVVIFWILVGLGFYTLSLGPYLHYKGVLDPPVAMPYMWIYKHLPFYENIRTVGRYFVWAMLAFSVLAAFGLRFIGGLVAGNGSKSNKDRNKEDVTFQLPKRGFRILAAKFVYVLFGVIIAVEFLAIPLKVNVLAHSSFYEKLGRDKGEYNVLEVPGNTDYDFASRDLVWRSIHRKRTINNYNFARVEEGKYSFHRGTPIIRALLYDIPKGKEKQNDTDMMKDAYYSISNEILNYYNIRYVILDKEGLKGDPKKEDKPNMFYAARAYVKNVIKCSDEYEDEFLYACQVDKNFMPQGLFLAMDFTNEHWIGRSKSKSGLQRWAENGAGVKLVNMSQNAKSAKFTFNVKVKKPLGLKVFFNNREVYDKYLTQIDKRQKILVDLNDVAPGENEITFGVRAADGSEVYSDKKSDTVKLYRLGLE